MDRDIAQRASRQHGNITRAQIIALGGNDDDILHRTRTGRLHRVHVGVYAVGRPATAPLEKAAAAVLACRPTAVLSHASAMTLWGFWRRWDRPLEVTVTEDRRPKGIRVHRSKNLHRRDIHTQHGIRTTSPARTLHDMARRLTDKQLTRAVNNALHTHYLSESQLQEFVSRHHTSLLKPFANATTALTRSELEDTFLAFCEQFGFPRPQTNILLNGYLVDAYFPEHRVIVELDSWQFHSTGIDFEKDRSRDADQLTEGIPTVRITHERITGEPTREAARLNKILASRASPRPARSQPRTSRRGSTGTPGAPQARHRSQGRPAR